MSDIDLYEYVGGLEPTLTEDEKYLLLRDIDNWHGKTRKENNRTRKNDK